MHLGPLLRGRGISNSLHKRENMTSGGVTRTSRTKSNRQIRKQAHTKGTHCGRCRCRSYLVSLDHVEAKAIIDIVHTCWVVGVIADAICTRICDNGRIDLWNSTNEPQLKGSFFTFFPSFSSSLLDFSSSF